MNLKQLWLIFVCLIMVNDMVFAQTPANFLAPGRYQFQHLALNSLQEQILFQSKSQRGTLVLNQLKQEGFKCQPQITNPQAQLCKKNYITTSLPAKVQQQISQEEAQTKSGGDIILGPVNQSEVYANGNMLTQYFVNQSLQYDQNNASELIYTFYHHTEAALAKVRTLDAQLGFYYITTDLLPYLYRSKQLVIGLPKTEFILDRAFVLQAQLVYLRTDA